MRGNGSGSGSNRTNGNRRPEEIQAEIARTRGEMDQTLSAIENRLTPGQLVDQGIDYLKNSGAREYLTNLTGTVKYNPMPVALTAIGIAWLIAMQNRPVQYRFIETRGGSVTSAGDETQPGMIDQASERLGEMKNRVGERMSDLSTTARQQADRVKSGWDTMLREHPLAIGAIGLAAGAVAAALAPRTRKEDELMGGARDRLMDQAASAATEKLEQGRQMASEALQSAKQEGGKELDNGPRNPS